MNPDSTLIKSENPPDNKTVFLFKAYPMGSELSNISPEASGKHIFGDEVARKIFLFTDKYTTQASVAPGNPVEKTVIRKPVIYESVIQIERHLKRSVKKAEIALPAASSQMNTVLDVALNIVSADTKDFEAAVAASGNAKSKMDLFIKRVILTY
jgi:hypothetical protein